MSLRSEGQAGSGAEIITKHWCLVWRAVSSPPVTSWQSGELTTNME